MQIEHYPFTLKPLPYPYDALAPILDECTLHFHHDKHLQAYVDNLNKALASYPQYHDWPLERLVSEYPAMPEEIRTAVKNNAGGVYNHELYFDGMRSPGQGVSNGSLVKAIQEEFGSMAEWEKQMKEAAVSQFGSGWAWLVYDEACKLHIVKTANQDVPPAKLHPILLVDVWEHAYYLQYQNRRPEYVEKWFGLIDWDKAEARFSCG